MGSPGLLFYSLRTLAAVAPYLSTDNVPLARMLVPKLIAAVKSLIPIDEAKACEALEALDELLESEAPVVTPHLSEVLAFCLEVARNVALGDAIRVRILCCLTFLVKVKSKALLKNRLLPPLLQTLFPIMAAEPPWASWILRTRMKKRSWRSGWQGRLPNTLLSRLWTCWRYTCPRRSSVPS